MQYQEDDDDYRKRKQRRIAQLSMHDDDDETEENGVETIVSRLSVQGVRAIIDDTDTGVAVLPISSTMYYTDFWSCLKSIEVTEGSAGLYKCIEYVLLNFSLLYGCGAWLANSAVKRIIQMSQYGRPNSCKADDPKGSNTKEYRACEPWSTSRNAKNHQYSWCQFDEAAKHFQEKMEAVQKELINDVKKLSSSSTPVALNVNPNIGFLPDEPVLIAAEEPLFDITNENENIIDMAIRLSSQSTMMLNKIKDLVDSTRLPFHVKYRLELRPASFYDTDIQHQLWELRMNLDPVSWFDLQWRQCGDDQEKQHTCLSKARSYIKKYRAYIPEQMPYESLQEPIRGPQYGEYPLTSTINQYPDHQKPVTIVCHARKTRQRDNGNGECGQYIMDEHIVMQWSVKPIIQLFDWQTFHSSQMESQKRNLAKDVHFIFTANREIIRDLVIFPKPPWHLTNRQLVQQPFFWATAILTIRMLHRQLEEKLLVQQEIWPVEAVAINFGQWETAGSYDKRLMNCHAHAHLLLDLAFINACDDTFFSALKGRVDQPPNYLKQNTQLLHFERLQNHEFDSQQMANFSQRLNNVENNLQGVTTDLQGVKTDLQNVTIDLQGLKDIVKNLTTGMEAMTTLLEKVYASVNKQPVEPPVNASQTSLNKGHDLLNNDPNGVASK
ncbi:unnamed protein product [Rotaria socialis]|uniref:Uncharacterized protein n=1 Tax=Rotaria socialis TaxID=392032 RepID=A0A821PSK9_9BILA|nr:unnamed protein product [Rotaria socialis]